MTFTQVFETLGTHNGSFQNSLTQMITPDRLLALDKIRHYIVVSLFKSLKAKLEHPCTVFLVYTYISLKPLFILKCIILLHVHKNIDIGIFGKRSKSRLLNHSSNTFGVVC